MTQPLAIDFVSDFVCPWCFIGLNRLDQALAAMPELETTFTAHPFFLEHDTPREGHDLRERLHRRFGGDPEPLFARVEQEARSSGIPLDFAKVRRWPSTLRAHTLVRHAREKGTQPGLVRALFRAYFLEEIDIGDVEQLVALGERFGFSPPETRAIVASADELSFTRDRAHVAARSGVTGVPFFVFGGRLAFGGAQPVEAIKLALLRASEEA